MKNIFIAFITLFFTANLISCQQGAAKKVKPGGVESIKDQTAKGDSPVMSFDNLSHDFGTIKEGTTL